MLYVEVVEMFCLEIIFIDALKDPLEFFSGSDFSQIVFFKE